MKRKLIMIFLAASVCLHGFGISAFGADALKVTVKEITTKSSQLSVTGFEQPIYSIQLELPISQTEGEFTFSPKNQDTYCFVQKESDKVIVYLDSKEPLNQEDLLLTGTLNSNTNFHIEQNAAIISVNEKLRPTEHGLVPVKTIRLDEDSDSTSSGTGGGGGSIKKETPKPTQSTQTSTDGITKTQIEEAIKQAKKDSKTSVTIPIDTKQGFSKINLEKGIFSSLKDSQIDTFIIECGDFSLLLNQNVINEIAQSQKEPTVIEIANKFENLSLSNQAVCADKIGYYLSIQSEEGKISLKSKIKFEIPYSKAEDLKLYQLENGKVQIVPFSYNEQEKSLQFDIIPEAIYFIGYHSIDFTDVTNHWAKDYIYYLSDRKMVNGMEDGSFLPNKTITRAEFTKILSSMDTDNVADNSQSIFEDVAIDAWYAPSIFWAYKNGIAHGIGDNLFEPNKEITREQICVMLYAFCNKMGYSLKTTQTNQPFSDQGEISDYAIEAVAAMRAAGIISGREDNLFAPKSNATRAEVCVMLYHLLEQL